MGEFVEKVKTSWQPVFITAVLSVTGTLIYSQAVMGGNMVSRAELAIEMAKIRELSVDVREMGRDLGIEISTIDRRLSRIEGQLSERGLRE